jgi:hypothetical protein
MNPRRDFFTRALSLTLNPFSLETLGGWREAPRRSGGKGRLCPRARDCAEGGREVRGWEGSPPLGRTATVAPERAGTGRPVGRRKTVGRVGKNIPPLAAAPFAPEATGTRRSDRAGRHRRARPSGSDRTARGPGSRRACRVVVAGASAPSERGRARAETGAETRGERETSRSEAEILGLRLAGTLRSRRSLRVTRGSERPVFAPISASHQKAAGAQLAGARKNPRNGRGSSTLRRGRKTVTKIAGWVARRPTPRPGAA